MVVGRRGSGGDGGRPVQQGEPNDPRGEHEGCTYYKPASSQAKCTKEEKIDSIDGDRPRPHPKHSAHVALEALSTILS